MPLKTLLQIFVLTVVSTVSTSPIWAQTEPASESQTLPPRSATLTVGDLTAEISDSGQAAPHAVGSSAFASIKLKMAGTPESRKAKKKTRNKAPEPVGSTIDFEAVEGEITSITGAKVTSSVNGQTANAQIPRLRPGEETTVLVEMRLKASAGEQVNLLKVTLKDAAGASSQLAELRWMVRDCAGDYYRELQTIAASGGSQLSKLLAELRTPDKSLPRTWIFRASSTVRSRGRCLRYRRQWDPEEYGYRRVCVRYRDGEQEQPTTASTSVNPKEEREIFQRANAFLRTGGADPKLSRKGSLEWVSGKVASDLRLYLEQPPHPALCTGATEFTNYYLKQSAGLKAHAEGVINSAAKAREMAAAKTAEAKQVLAAMQTEQSGETPTATPISDQSGEQPLRSLVIELAPYSGLSPEAVAALEQAPDDLAVLQTLKDGMDTVAEPDKAARAILMPALAMIEAAVHMTRVEARYQDVRTKFIGGFENVKAAHDKFCVCGG